MGAIAVSVNRKKSNRNKTMKAKATPTPLTRTKKRTKKAMVTSTPLQRTSTNANTSRQVKVVKNDEGRVTKNAQTTTLEVVPPLTDDLETLVAEGLAEATVAVPKAVA